VRFFQNRALKNLFGPEEEKVGGGHSSRNCIMQILVISTLLKQRLIRIKGERD